MKTYAERLEWAMICAGLNPRTDQSTLAKQIPCKPQVIQHLLNHDKNAKGSKYTPRISTILRCDVNWLSDNLGKAPTQGTNNNHKTGIGDAPISGSNTALIKDFPTTSKHTIGGEMTSSLVESGVANVSVALRGHREIPILSLEQASKMAAMVDPYTLAEGLGTVTAYREVSAAAFAIPIKGPSMLPRFEDGDVVIIDPARAPKPGKFVLAALHTGASIFRKYRELGANDRGEMVFELAPLNNDFATLHSERDRLRIIGAMDAHINYDRDE